MTVRISDDGAAILVAGDCPIDEAELLQRLLAAHKDAPVDWRACSHLHTALVQLLLAAGRPVMGPCADDFLQRWIAPRLPAFMS